MTRHQVFPLLLVCALLASLSHASNHPSPECVPPTAMAGLEALRMRPITPTPQERKPSERASGGRVLRETETLGTLDDGINLYIRAWNPVTNEEIAILIPRVEASPDPSSDFFGTHRSAAQRLPPGFLIVGAGEIRMLNGLCMEFNNGSGTFRGDTKSLQESLEWFKARGLRVVDDHTWIRDYSLDGVKPVDHGAEWAMAVAQAQYRTGHLAPVLAKARRLYAKLQKHFPSPIGHVEKDKKDYRPGSVDPTAVYLHLYDKDELRYAGELSRFLAIANYDGVEWALDEALTSRPGYTQGRVMDNLGDKAEQYAKDMDRILSLMEASVNRALPD